jgi:CheY-like chemotaxis protein
MSYFEVQAMPKTILIVEDYADSRSLMRFMLESNGYAVIEASNGEEAVETVKSHVPDLILMDMSMPVMDGLTATRILRKFDATARLPIIAVTAYGKSYYRQAMEAGCDDLINKPLDPRVLEPILDQYLGH